MRSLLTSQLRAAGSFNASGFGGAIVAADRARLGFAQPSRGVAALAMRGGAGVVGAVAAYVLYQVAARGEWNQRRRIRSTILAPQADLAVFHPGPLFLARPEKHAFITDLFNSDPAGPIVVTGPQGSGKTMVLKRALAGRAESVYVDLRATPAPTGDALAATLVEKAGYLFPPNELLGRAIFTRDAVSSANISLELDRACRLITTVLREKKAANWVARMPRGERSRIVPPLFCIDELNLGGDGAALLDDPTFWRFVDWVLFLTDNRLAHVVLATSLDVAATLDAYPGWRARRQKVHIDYPRPSTVAHYLESTVNPFLVRVLNATPRTAATLRPLNAVVAPSAAAVELHEASASELPSAHTLMEPALAPAPVDTAARLRVGLRTFFLGSSASAQAAAEGEPAAAPSSSPPNDGSPAVSVSTAVALDAEDMPLRGSPAILPATTAPARALDSTAVPTVALGEGPTILVASARAAEPNAALAPPAAASGHVGQEDGAHSAAAGPGTVGGTACVDDTCPEDTPVDASGVLADTVRAGGKLSRPRRAQLHTLSASEINTIVETVGGHLKDLDTVVTSVARGKQFQNALDLLVADSAELVERMLETLLSAAEGGTGDGSGGGGVTSTASASSASAAARTGGSRTPSRARLLPLAAPPAFRGGAPFPRPAWNYLVAPKGDRLAAYARYLRMWDMLEVVALRKFVPRRELALRVFVGCPHELELYADAGIIAIMSVRAAGGATASSSAAPLDAQSDFELPGALVYAASPRLRAAFRALVSDKRLRAQTSAVRGALRLARARDTEAELARRLPEAVSERAYWASMVSALLARDTALRGSVAKELMLLQSAAPVTGADFLSSGSLTAQPAAVENEAASPDSAGATRPAAPSTLLGTFGLNDSLQAALRSLKSAEAELERLRAALTAARDDIVAGEAVADAILLGGYDQRDQSSAAVSVSPVSNSAAISAAVSSAPMSPQPVGRFDDERFDLLDGDETESDDEDADGAGRDRDPRVFSTSFWLPSIQVARGRRALGSTPPREQGSGFRTSFFLPAPSEKMLKNGRGTERTSQGKKEKYRWWL